MKKKLERNAKKKILGISICCSFVVVISFSFILLKYNLQRISTKALQESILKETMVIEEIEKMSEEENTNEIGGSTLSSTKEYSNNSIQFSYSNDINLVEEQGEDGKTVKLFMDNTEGNLITISQGEAWRVNLEYTEEEYKELLKEMYEDIIVTEYKKIKMDGNDGIKIKFNYKIGDKIFYATNFLVIAGYSGFEISCEYSEEKLYKNSLEPIILSIQFN